MTIIGELAYWLAPTLAPYFGYGTCAVLILWYVDSPWSSMWLVVTSIFLTAFVSLCGIVYRNIKDRLEENEKSIKQVIQNMDVRFNEINKKQDRMFGMFLLQAVQMSDGDKTKLIDSIKDIIERER